MKYIILLLATLFLSTALAKTPRQILGALEAQQILPIQETHNLVLKQIQSHKISERAGALKIRELLANLINTQNERMKKTNVKGLMLQQLQAYYQDLQSVMKSEIEVFEGRSPRDQLKAPVSKFVATINNYKQLLDETPIDTVKRLGYNSAQLEDTTIKAFQLALQGKMKKEEAMDILQRQIPSAFAEIEKEQDAILNQFKQAEDQAAIRDMIQISRINAMSAWKYGNALRTGDKKFAAEADSLVNQRNALVAKIRGGESAQRQTAATN